MKPHWSQGLHQLFKHQGIRQVSFVPDAGHAALIGLCEADRELRAVRLTTEEEGIALAVGAWHGGDKSVLLIAAVAKACGFVLATMVTTIEQVSRLRAHLHHADGPLFAQVKVAPDKLPLVLPPRDGAHLKDRFREALLGKDAYFQR